MNNAAVETHLVGLLRDWFISAALAVSFGVSTQTALAQTVTESDVIRLALANSPDVRVANAAIELAEANRLAHSLYPNPELSWTRESLAVADSADEREDALTVSFPVDLSSRRPVRDRLAQVHTANNRAEAAFSRSQTVVRALTLFYQLTAEKQLTRIEQRSVDQLTEAVRVITHRKQQGIVSGYDQVRMEIAAELAQNRLNQSRARANTLKVELTALLGLDPTESEFQGSLASRDLAQPSETPPSLVWLQQANAVATEAQELANKTWIPAFSITAGSRTARVNGTQHGYELGFSIELPFFSRGQDMKAQARAQQRLTDVVTQAHRNSLAIRTIRAQSALDSALAEANRFTAAIADRVDRLERAAESGYREGDRSMIELLDARQTRTAVETRRVELAVAVKHAEIALRAAQGEFE